MKDGLLLIERIVIESLAKKDQSIYELEADTKLDHQLLANLIPNLVSQGVVSVKRGVYALDKEKRFGWLKEINKTEHIKEEAKEIFTTLVNQYFKKEQALIQENATQLKIQKIWLTKDEDILLKSHLATLEGFFKSVKEQRSRKPEREKTCEQRVVIWGLTDYSDLVEGSLRAV